MSEPSKMELECCFACRGVGKVCDECDEPYCTEAERCRECGGTGLVSAGTYLRENGEPLPCEVCWGSGVVQFVPSPLRSSEGSSLATCPQCSVAGDEDDLDDRGAA